MPTMPRVVGVGLREAEALLEAAGVLSEAALGYFGTWPISVQWLTTQQLLTQFITADSTLVTVDETLFTVDGALVRGVPIAQTFPPGFVAGQSIQEGSVVAVNVPLVLNVIQFPMGVSYPA